MNIMLFSHLVLVEVGSWRVLVLPQHQDAVAPQGAEDGREHCHFAFFKKYLFFYSGN